MRILHQIVMDEDLQSSMVTTRNLLLLGGILGDLLGLGEDTSDESDQTETLTETDDESDGKQNYRGYSPAGGSIAWVVVVSGFVFINVLICLVFAARRYRINRMIRRYQATSTNRNRVNAIEMRPESGRHPNQSQRSQRIQRSIDQGAIDKHFPIMSYSDIRFFPSQLNQNSADQEGVPEKTDENEHDWNCSICLEDFKDADSIRQLGCTHIFHYNCIDKWIKRGNTCPLCRREVFTMQDESGEVVVSSAVASVPTNPDSSRRHENVRENYPATSPRQTHTTDHNEQARSSESEIVYEEEMVRQTHDTLGDLDSDSNQDSARNLHTDENVQLHAHL